MIQTSLTASKPVRCVDDNARRTIGRNARHWNVISGANVWATGGAAVAWGNRRRDGRIAVFSMEAWKQRGFAGSELKERTADLPLAMGAGYPLDLPLSPHSLFRVLIVTILYVLANVAYFDRPARVRDRQRRAGRGRNRAATG